MFRRRAGWLHDSAEDTPAKDLETRKELEVASSHSQVKPTHSSLHSSFSVVVRPGVVIVMINFQELQLQVVL